MTQWSDEGRAPIELETYNTLTFITVSGTGQLGDVTCKRAVFLARPGNSGNVFLGSETGIYTFPLEAGFGISLEVENLNQVFYQTTGGDRLHVTVLTEV